MNISGHYRYSNCLEEDQPTKRSRSRPPVPSSDDVPSLVEQFPEDPTWTTLHELGQATATIKQLSAKASQIQALFSNVIARYPSLSQHATFCQNVAHLQRISQYCAIVEQILRVNIDTAPAQILNQQEALVTDFLWMNNQELVTAYIISELQ